MQYLFVIWEGPETASSPERRGRAMQAMGEYVGALAKKAVVKGGAPLAPGAVQVRKRAGRVTKLDGPFVETREMIGGYFVIEASSMEQALELAESCPAAEYGAVEVHPILGAHQGG